MRNYYGLRCSAKRVTKHKVTFSFVNGSASGTYTSSPPAGGAVSLRLVSVAVPQAELRFSVSPGDRFIAAPLLRSPRGEARFGAIFHGTNRGRQMKKYVIQLFYRRKKPLAVTLTDTVRQPLSHFFKIRIRMHGVEILIRPHHGHKVVGIGKIDNAVSIPLEAYGQPLFCLRKLQIP